jgi:hypothetical protein
VVPDLFHGCQCFLFLSFLHGPVIVSS